MENTCSFISSVKLTSEPNAPTCCHHRGCWLAGHTVSPSSLGGTCRRSLGGPSGGSRPAGRRLSDRADTLAPPLGPATACWSSELRRSRRSRASGQPPGPGASRWCTGYGGSHGNRCRCVLLSCAATTTAPPVLRPVLACLEKTSVCADHISVQDEPVSKQPGWQIF